MTLSTSFQNQNLPLREAPQNRPEQYLASSEQSPMRTYLEGLRIITSQEFLDIVMTEKKWHIICEKDVGLFSLVQQVIGHIPLSLKEQRVPIVHFGPKCCYWNENGYQGEYNVWEYYFEPLIPEYAAKSLPKAIINHLNENHPDHEKSGYFLNEKIFVSNNFGNHPDFNGKSLKIPYQWSDPDATIRKEASEIIQQYVKPKPDLLLKTNAFFQSNMSADFTVGVHIRATDVSDLKTEHNIHRRNSYKLEQYFTEVRRALKKEPQAKVFVATDSQEALNSIKQTFTDKVIYYSSIFHSSGELSGKGPSGWGLPAYLTKDAQIAAQNGEEAVIDYLLLSKCQLLIHNGSSLPRTALLKNPELKHVNVHSKKEYIKYLFSFQNLELLHLFKIVIIKKLVPVYKLIKQLFIRER